MLMTIAQLFNTLNEENICGLLHKGAAEFVERTVTNLLLVPNEKFRNAIKFHGIVYKQDV